MTLPRVQPSAAANRGAWLAPGRSHGHDRRGPAGRDQEGNVMTKSALTMIQSASARAACRQRTDHDLRVLRDIVEQAHGMPADAWEPAAAVHAHFHCLLADATAVPGLAILARFIDGSMQDMITAAGPSTQNLIIASRHRLLRHLEARDADGAAREMEDLLMRLDQACGQAAPSARPVGGVAEELAHE
jgi:GntR family transcriptional repressor for pyruvate dehydrogenase complex